MQLTINGQTEKFIPVREFCEKWGLPDWFQTGYFEPKNWDGLGSMDGAGDALEEVRGEVIAAIPEIISSHNILAVVDLLTQSFQQHLETANELIGLRLHDVGFAVAGFQDVIRDVAYQLLRLKHTHQSDFDFRAVYMAWLEASVRVSSTKHIYRHGGMEFEVYIINNVYGRVGLEVHINGKIYYVADKSLACPGEGYMWELCQEVAQVLCDRFSR